MASTQPKGGAMALNLTEAGAVNDLLDHLLGRVSNTGRVDNVKAKDAAHILAQAAYKRLAAGVTGHDVQTLWRDPGKRKQEQVELPADDHPGGDDPTHGITVRVAVLDAVHSIVTGALAVPSVQRHDVAVWLREMATWLDGHDKRLAALAPAGTPKMVLEALNAGAAQLVAHARAVDEFEPDAGSMARAQAVELGALAAQVQRHRPVDTDGTHGDLHTDTCGCEGHRTTWAIVSTPTGTEAEPCH